MRLFILVLSFLFFCNKISGQEDSLNAPNISGYESITNPTDLIVSGVTFKGNKTTRDFILSRELAFSEGGIIPAGKLGDKMARTRQNLMNTSLFNFVELKHTIKNDTVSFIITVVERWYIWPVPFFEIAETNFNTWWLTKDLRRTVYGLYISHDNFRGRREGLRAKIQLGYTHQFALQYNIPYINKNRTIGAGITASYYSNKEIVVGTVDNKRVFLKDTEKYVREEFYLRPVITYRKEIYNTHTFSARFNTAEVQDTILDHRPDYFAGGGNKTSYFSLGYLFVRDRRDYKAYPLRGYLLAMGITKSGLGFLENEPDNWLFSPVVRRYFKMSEKWYYAISGEAGVTAGKIPYYQTPGLGYSNEVRGYDYYIIDGQHWTLGRSNLKYRIGKPGVKKLKFVPLKKFNTIHYAFYLNAFADAGYVWDDLYFSQNHLANKFLAGYGIGLDFVTYYDWVLRLEVARNRLNETGFFINFTAPI